MRTTLPANSLLQLNSLALEVHDRWSNAWLLLVVVVAVEAAAAGSRCLARLDKRLLAC
jgi:hypothetical protein